MASLTVGRRLPGDVDGELIFVVTETRHGLRKGLYSEIMRLGWIHVGGGHLAAASV